MVDKVPPAGVGTDAGPGHNQSLSQSGQPGQAVVTGGQAHDAPPPSPSHTFATPQPAAPAPSDDNSTPRPHQPNAPRTTTAATGSLSSSPERLDQSPDEVPFLQLRLQPHPSPDQTTLNPPPQTPLHSRDPPPQPIPQHLVTAPNPGALLNDIGDDDGGDSDDDFVGVPFEPPLSPLLPLPPPPAPPVNSQPGIPAPAPPSTAGVSPAITTPTPAELATTSSAPRQVLLSDLPQVPTADRTAASAAAAPAHTLHRTASFGFLGLNAPILPPKHGHHPLSSVQQSPPPCLTPKPPTQHLTPKPPSPHLTPKPPTPRAMSDNSVTSTLDRDQMQGLKTIREFLKLRTSYDVLPMSFRLIVLDTDLLIKKSLTILIQNNIVSAPLWDSHRSKFAGLLTSTDYINMIQYYCQYPDEIRKLDQFRLSSLRDIEKAIGAMPLETVSVHPMRPLYDACRYMLKTRARRIPLVDFDGETGRETVVSVITQYRILKFIAVNNEHHTLLLKRPVRQIGVGTYDNLATTSMDSTVLDVVHLMVRHNISCVPILDDAGRVLNVFEAVDIIPCLKSGTYDGLSDTVAEALCQRSDDYPGILTCSEEDRLSSIFETIRKSPVHRLIVIDDDGLLKGVISLSDILKYVLLTGEDAEAVNRSSAAPVAAPPRVR